MKRITALFILVFTLSNTYAVHPVKVIYQLTIYHFENKEQEKAIDDYLSKGLLPALHRTGINNVGVFKSLGNDTTADKRIYVLTPHKSLNKYLKLSATLNKDAEYKTNASGYLNAPFNNAPYKRIENILLKNFDPAMGLRLPKLNSKPEDRVYELRSYESPTEKLHLNKLHMFIEGGETKIFENINANPIFYGSVIAGSNMPNLMYMTSFENKVDRDAHWKAFGTDPDWGKLKVMDFYKKNVSHIDINFLRPTEYSDL